MAVGGAVESAAAAYVGTVEAPLPVRPYLTDMGRGEHGHD